MGNGSGEANSLQGEFGEAWLEAVAAGCGLLHGRPTTLDLQKADVQLFLPGTYSNTYNPSVLVQVKTTIDLRVYENGDLGYDLDAGTYEVLRRDDHANRRVLAVVGVSADGDRVRLEPDGTLLVGRAAWVSLEGGQATTNTAKKTIRLPAANSIDKPGLTRMLTTYGIRRSTPVPDVDPWESP